MGRGVQSGEDNLMDPRDWAEAGAGHSPPQHWAHLQKLLESFEKDMNFGSHSHAKLTEYGISLQA